MLILGNKKSLVSHLEISIRKIKERLIKRKKQNQERKKQHQRQEWFLSTKDKYILRANLKIKITKIHPFENNNPDKEYIVYFCVRQEASGRFVKQRYNKWNVQCTFGDLDSVQKVFQQHDIGVSLEDASQTRSITFMFRAEDMIELIDYGLDCIGNHKNKNCMHKVMCFGRDGQRYFVKYCSYSIIRETLEKSGHFVKHFCL